MKAPLRIITTDRPAERVALAAAIARRDAADAEIAELEKALQVAFDRSVALYTAEEAAKAVITEEAASAGEQLANSLLGLSVDDGPIRAAQEELARIDRERPPLRDAKAILETRLGAARDRLGYIRSNVDAAISDVVRASPEFADAKLAFAKAQATYAEARHALEALYEICRPSPGPWPSPLPVDVERATAWSSAVKALDRDAEAALPK